MSTWSRLAIFGVLAALMSLQGCERHHEGPGPYRYEHGDRIDRYGHRDVRWCDAHHEDPACR
jgi:hypothetical protein